MLNAAQRFVRSAEILFARIAARRLVSCAVVVAVTLLVRTALLPIDPKPHVRVEDEFAYILQGETFAAGRLTTPTPPMWRFFETIYVNMQPTYASKYPPAQSLFLALGIRLLDHPWYGVLISNALMCGCICWMLQGWVPPKYALLGGLLAFAQFGVTHYWMDSYWGGAVAGIGGALVFGSIPRLARDGRASAALAMAAGIAILANSRPFEGLVVVLLSFIGLIAWTRRRTFVWRRPRVLLVLGAVLLIAAGATLRYNQKVTGSYLTLPYSVNQRLYNPSPSFWFLPLNTAPKSYRDESMRRLFEEQEVGRYTRIRHNPLLVARHLLEALAVLLGNGSGTLLPFLSVCAIPLVSSPRMRLAFSVLALFMGAMTLSQATLPHYLAPAVGVSMVIAMSGLRLLRVVRLRGQPTGSLVVAGLLSLAFVLFIFDTARTIVDKRHFIDTTPQAFRDKVEARLTSEPGRHLVLIHYSPDHDYQAELVYNGPDIDSQKIIWAFDLGREKDRSLLSYYRDRKVWMCEPDGPHPALEPYQDR